LIGAQLKAIAADGQAAADATCATAELAPVDQQATSLRNTAAACKARPRKAQLGPLEDRQGLGPGRAGGRQTELLKADPEQRSQRGRFGWASRLGSPEWWPHDQQTAQQLAPNGTAWNPDLCREFDRPENSPPPMPSAWPGLLQSLATGSVPTMPKVIRLAVHPEAHRARPHPGLLGSATAKTGTGTPPPPAPPGWLPARNEAHAPASMGKKRENMAFTALSLNPCPIGVSSQQLEAAGLISCPKIPYME